MAINIITSRSTVLGDMSEYFNEDVFVDSTVLHNDVSMPVVAKILLHGRTSPNDCAAIRLWKINPNFDADIEREDGELFNGYVYYDVDYDHNIQITEIQADQSSTHYQAIINDTDKSVHRRLGNGYERSTAIEKFVEQKTSMIVRVYINKEHNKSMVVTPDMTPQCYHALISVLPLMLPKYFEGDKALTTWEKELLNALCEKDQSKFISMLNSYGERYDLKYDRVRKLLSGFTKSFGLRESNLLKDDIATLNSNIDRYYKAIQDYYAQLEEKESKLRIVTEKMCNYTDDDDTELTDFIMSCKGITLNSVRSSELDITIKTPLRNYDADLFEKFLDNPRSILYCIQSYYPNREPKYTLDECNKLMSSILLDNKLDVMMSGRLCLDFASGGFVVQSNRPTYGSEDDTIHNPHLTYYQCLGGNKKELYDALRTKDYVGALNVCIASVGNVNIGETTNMLNFMRDLLLTQGKVLIRRSDKQDLTIDEAIAWLKEEEANE